MKLQHILVFGALAAAIVAPRAYAMDATPASQAEQAMDALPDIDLDCILFLGTGLPTLPVIAGRSSEALPVLSPNMCLMWRAVLAATGTPPTRENLLSWVTGHPHWLGRFQEWTAA